MTAIFKVQLALISVLGEGRRREHSTRKSTRARRKCCQDSDEADSDDC